MPRLAIMFANVYAEVITIPSTALTKYVGTYLHQAKVSIGIIYKGFRKKVKKPLSYKSSGCLSSDQQPNRLTVGTGVPV